MKKQEKILLVKSVKNWADEMNLGGFAIFTEKRTKAPRFIDGDESSGLF